MAQVNPNNLLFLHTFYLTDGEGGKNTLQAISACRQDINEITSATPIFASIPTRL